LCSFCGTQYEDCTIDLKEDGKVQVDCSGLETGLGDIPNKDQLARWRVGRQKLYSVRYLAKIEKYQKLSISAEELGGLAPQITGEFNDTSEH
jgi:hypothetical protein